MKQETLQTISFRLPESTLSRLADVAEVLRRERKLTEHQNRQQLLQEAIDDFIAKHLPKQ